MSKPLHIGMIGCGFMGRTHSNAWLQVNHFFPREHQPVLKACYGREEDQDKLEEFAKPWGYESIETDWRKLIARDDIDLVDICVPNIMHHDMRDRRGRGGQDDRLREAAGDERRRGRGDGRRRREGRRGQHGLVQLPPRAGHLAVQADHRRRPHRPAVPLPGHLQPGLHDRRRRAPGRHGPVAARRQGGRLAA